MNSQYDIGMVGLGVMGSNLALNMSDKGFRVAGYDRDHGLLEKFTTGAAKGRDIMGCSEIAEFCASLSVPRKIMIMVKAGDAVDWVIAQLLPHIAAGDILIDGGNSHYPDTVRRAKMLEEKGMRFIGSGVSGGEEGARRGPSLMPGGSAEAWPHIKGIFQAIAAKADDGEACCQFMGTGGAGHFVKMVHNGIEYGDMQMICEAYWIMREVLGMSAAEQASVFNEWNKGELKSYLIEITAEILGKTDDETGKPLVEMILDTAGQKGTGKWTSVTGLDFGTPIPTIAEAVFARCLSAIKEERVRASAQLCGPDANFSGDKAALVECLRQALYAAKICSYAQGFQLMQYAAKENGWELNYGNIAMVWRAGCIIRASFLQHIKNAFDADPNCENLLLVPFFKDAIAKAQPAWRRTVMCSVEYGVPAPCISSALSYYDAYRSSNLPANLLQAQRDYFGAHTYERVDKARGQFFHTQWFDEKV